MMTGSLATSLLDSVRWGVDRTVAVGYGVVWDYIFEHFPPCRQLREEVVGLVQTATPPASVHRDVRILDIGCGPGNLTFALAERGFSVVGIDPYAPLIELAREKRRAGGLPNLAFQHGELPGGATRWTAAFDHVVNVHTLYLHPDPDRLLAEAYRALRPGGHAVFVNRARRLRLGAAFSDVRAAEGIGAALRALLWLAPNAVFEAARKRVGPHYWTEAEFTARLEHAGFTVLDMRRTFFKGSSVLACVRKTGAP